MEVDRNRFDEVARLRLAFVLRLAPVLGGLGFVLVFAVALLIGGIYLIATGHPSGGYALVGASVLAGGRRTDLGVGGGFEGEKRRDEQWN